MATKTETGSVLYLDMILLPLYTPRWTLELSDPEF